MVLHSLNVDIRSTSLDLEEALRPLYGSSDLRSELPSHTASLTIQIERRASSHALEIAPITGQNGVFAENNLCGCPCFYADGRFYGAEDEKLEIEYDLNRHLIRVNVGGRYASSTRMVAIQVVRGVLQSFVLPFYGLKPMHGAVVSGEGRTLMLIGRGEAGKTTTALKLLQHGFELLSDDAPLFLLEEGQARVLSSLDYYHVSPGTLDLLPWLRDHVIGTTDIRGKLAVARGGLQTSADSRRPRCVTHVVELHRGPVAAARITTGDRSEVTARLLREAMVVFRPDVMRRDGRFARYSSFVFDVLTLLMRDAEVRRLDFADHHLETLPGLLGGAELDDC